MKDDNRIKKLEERVLELEEYLSEVIHRMQYEIPSLVTSIMAAEDDEEILEISRRWAEGQAVDEDAEDYEDNDLLN